MRKLTELDTLADLYLAELKRFGVHVGAAAAAASMEVVGDALNLSKLSPEDAERRSWLLSWMTQAAQLFSKLHGAPPLRRRDAGTDLLSPADIDAITTAAESDVRVDSVDVLEEYFPQAVPQYGRYVLELDEIEKRASLTPEQVTEKVFALLTGNNGERAPSLKEWLSTQGLAGNLTEARLRILLARRSQQEVEEERDELREQLGLSMQLGDRITLPGPIISTFRDDGDSFQKRLARLSQGDLFADARVIDLLGKATATIATGQFMRLPTMRIRAITGLLHLFSTAGDDRREFLRSSVRVPFSVLCQAAGIDLRQGKLRRDLFDAFDWLSRTPVYIPLELEREDGQREVRGERTPICAFTPIWTNPSPEESQSLVRQWARRTGSGDDIEPWTENLPDECEITLPAVARFIFRALHVNADILQRLESGAKSVRGGAKGFLDIDWALCLEISQNVQPQQVSDDGCGLKSFIDRESFFLTFFGEEELDKHRKTGHFKSRVVEKYEKAAEVLVEAGIVTKWTPAHKAKRGERDVFDCNPEVFLGQESRVQRQKVLQKQPRRRGRKKLKG